MSISYHLEFITECGLTEIVDNIKLYFNLRGFEDDLTFLSNGDGLGITFIDMDEEAQEDAVATVGMFLNKRMYFSFKTNYLECQKLMFSIVVYALEKIDGDISFTRQGEDAILERRDSILSIDEKTPDYYPELVEMLNTPYTVKILEVADLPDDD
jgi:hypothetical protein